MALFTKVVATAGRYAVSDDKGQRHVTDLTGERFDKWVKTFKRLKSKGYHTPAPFDHDVKNGVPFKMGVNGSVPALKNAGFVVDLKRQDIDGTPSLVAVIDVPGDENDAKSLAYKVGKTVKETSVYVRPNYLDGTGEIYEEALMHAALVTHAIEPGQSNFKPAQANDLSIAMSQRIVMGSGLSPQIGDTDDETDPDGDDGNGGPDAGKPAHEFGTNVAEIVAMLRDSSIGIDLPDDTTEENILTYLRVAARQRAKGQQPQQMTPQAPPPPPPAGGMGQDPMNPMGGQPGQQPPGGQAPGQSPQQPGQKPQPASPPVNVKKPPRKAVEQPPTIAMSTPNTPDLAVVMSQIEGLTEANKLLAGYVTRLEADKRAARIAALVASGRVTKDYADANLSPALAGFQMSIGSDGTPVQAPIDTILIALEALPARTGSVVGTMVGMPASAFAGLPPEAQQAVATVLMNMGGGMPAGGREEDHPNSRFYTGAPEPVTEQSGIEHANTFLKNVGNP